MAYRYDILYICVYNDRSHVPCATSTCLCLLSDVHQTSQQLPRSVVVSSFPFVVFRCALPSCHNLRLAKYFLNPCLNESRKCLFCGCPYSSLFKWSFTILQTGQNPCHGVPDQKPGEASHQGDWWAARITHGASSDRDGGLESNGLKSPFGVESRVSTPAVTWLF